jgi:hypothetical protein
MISVSTKVRNNTVRFKLDLLEADQLRVQVSKTRDKVVQRIKSGNSAEQRPLKPYSTRTIKIPVAGLGSGTQKIRPQPPGGRKVHARGAKFVRFRFGYSQFRSQAGLQTSHKDLSLTGALLQGFKARVYTASRASIGWTKVKDEEIALELERKENQLIFALSETEAQELEEAIMNQIMANLAQYV